MLSGFGLFVTLVFLEVSTIQDPVAFWKIIMQIGFIAGSLGTLMVLLVSLSFVPGALRFAWHHSQQHLKTHGKCYITAIYAIGAGLSAMTLAMLEAYGTVFGDTSENEVLVDHGDEVMPSGYTRDEEYWYFYRKWD